MKLFGFITALNRYGELLAEIDVVSDETVRVNPITPHFPDEPQLSA
jgi:hypothetical protein